MDDLEFDRAFIRAAFDLLARQGWRRLSLATAAREANLSLEQARLRFPNRMVLLMRFGRMADARALAEAPASGPVRDRLFDMMMRRFDVLQAHRGGVLALLRALPAEPELALLLSAANLTSMRWLLDAAGVAAHGPLGRLRAKALLGVWLYAVRAWMHDHTEDLSKTMAALDRALDRAERLARWLPGGGAEPDASELPPEEPPPSPLGEAPAPTAP
jgi:ubiquinone biosynthesis protein COQ9